MPPDLAEYLRKLISPEHRVENCVFLHLSSPTTYDWKQHADASVHGLVVEADSVETQAEWLPEAYRVLKPGAHLLLAAPEAEPLGDTGACSAEDIGFEVRDAIMWVDKAGDGEHLHYVAKAGRGEREEGLGHLPDKPFAASGGAQGALSDAEDAGEEDAAVYGEEGDIGLNRITQRKNTHPTCKPKEVMARLLADVPKDQGVVLDPFLGSGTTLLACLETGHDGLGIEREAEYVEIADARVRYWDAAQSGWNPAVIVSDYKPEAAPTEEVAFDDFLGL